MKLPNAGQVIVDKEKIINYLLNEAHPDNGGKATFFHEPGFDREEWSRFSSVFTILAGTTRITKIVESSHGSKYILDGRIEGPGGKAAFVRTIWILDRNGAVPRLVTAYPHIV